MIFAIVAETASPGMGNPILAGVWRPAHTHNLPFQVLSCFCTRVGVAIRYATCQNSLLLAQARDDRLCFVYVVSNSGS